MPIVTVKGLPHELSMASELYHGLKAAVAGITELEIAPEQVSVFMPIDGIPFSVRKEVVVEVVADDKPERTKDVLDRLAGAVRDVLAKSVTGGLIEVLVVPFRRETGGFATSLVVPEHQTLRARQAPSPVEVKSAFMEADVVVVPSHNTGISGFHVLVRRDFAQYAGELRVRFGFRPVHPPVYNTVSVRGQPPAILLAELEQDPLVSALAQVPYYGIQWV